MNFWFRIAALCALGLACGCGNTPPPVTEVEGVVLLDEQPLPQAYVEFVPDLKNFGAKINSTATTDAEGKFRLICNLKAQPGAVIAKHWIVVTDPAPEIARKSGDHDADRAAQNPPAQLPNRPIPPEYGSVGTTPLKIDVTKDNKTYVLKLTRKS
jgi:hypothetical protein